jgi:NAD(P)-dependent dehydrogenase (short-subunit alcohol dehydrogenase family)
LVIDQAPTSTLLAGFGGGTGRAIGQRMASRGNTIALLGSHAAALAPTLAEDGIRAEGFVVDLTDRAAIETAVTLAEQRLGRIKSIVLGDDALVSAGALSATTLATWSANVNAPLVRAFEVCQAVLPRLAARREGAVLFVLSDYAVIGRRDGASFAAGQSALYSFVKCLAREFAPAGIRVNAVGAGPSIEGAADEGETTAPMGRMVRPGDLAAVAEFLLGERASYITGQLLQPNCGRVMS